MKRSTGASRTRRMLLVALSILVAAHRLPAPIVESEEKPTPAVEKSEARKQKQSVKSRLNSTEREQAKIRPSPSTASIRPILQGPAKFAGTWTGTINQGILGNPQVKVIVNANAISVTHSSNLGGAMGTHAATINGNTLKWHTGWGWLNGLSWALTPNPDGQTALTTSKSLVSAHGPAVFSRIQSAESGVR